MPRPCERQFSAIRHFPESKRFDPGIELLCNVHRNVSIARLNRFDSGIELLSFAERNVSIPESKRFV
jgi:hypothetical protein